MSFLNEIYSVVMLSDGPGGVGSVLIGLYLVQALCSFRNKIAMMCVIINQNCCEKVRLGSAHYSNGLLVISWLSFTDEISPRIRGIPCFSNFDLCTKV